MDTMIWFERKFKFDLPPQMYPNVVERVRGTPARLEEKLRGLPDKILKRHPEKGWSIQELAGHLLVVETLWHKRNEDFKAGKAELFAADVENSRTKETDFHKIPIEKILKDFRASREKLVAFLDSVSDNQVTLSARHPRLNQPMRIIDHAFFIAEHDDHHLAQMSTRIKRFR
jgi:uncharacterized damage-inducible protein DinB